MKVWSAYLNEAIEVQSVTPERLVDDEIGGSGDDGNASPRVDPFPVTAPAEQECA